MDLRAHQAENELMIGLVESGRFNNIRGLNRVDEIRNRDVGRSEQGKIGHHVKLGHLPTLHDHGADASDAVQRRLQVVGRNLPELGLRHRVRCQTVAKNWESREGEPVGRDFGGGRQ